MSKLSDAIAKSKTTTPPKQVIPTEKTNTLVLGGITLEQPPARSSVKPVAKPLELTTRPQQPQPANTSVVIATPAAATSVAKPSPLAALGDIQLDIRSDVADWPHEENENYSDETQTQLRQFLQEVNASLVTDDVSNAMQRCLTFIHQHPETKDFLLPEDIGLMTRALQCSNGIVIAKKQTNRTKKAKTQVKVDELSDALADMGDWLA